jgi:ectoine hydroxylase-related dioxygenase (phytanoyl-CoA dioxygenase family)
VKKYLSNEEIDSYKNQGAIVIKDVFRTWIDLLRTGFEKVLNEPGPHARENVKNEEGRFFEDYCNWQRITEFKKFAEESPAAQIVAEATDSKSIQLFHEHIFVKDPGTAKETPWHQDMPYYCVDGNDTGSFWIPLDPITKENSLQILLGSHKLPKLIRPTKWSNNQSWYKNDDNFMDMPDIKSIEKNILKPEMKLGDAILFNFKVLHSSSGNSENIARRAFSMRFIGDDVKYIDRGGETSPPFKDINLKIGSKMREDWFPVVWSN